MKFTFNDGTEVDIEIIRKNNKNLYFRFKEDLKLYVFAPMYISQKEILKLIGKNEEEIYNMYTKMEEKVKNDEMFWYLGNKYYIVFDDSEEVTFNGREVHAKNQEQLDSFLNREMLRIYNEEVEISKKCFTGLPDFTLKTRKMSTRWGVCNTKKKIITLNTELIKKEIDLIDYVIIHEMCHFFEANHSRNFWALVGQAYPKYKEARKRLRD